MEQFDIWAFLAGLALFVFGMNVLEDSIHALGYNQLKKFLSKTVNTRIKAIFAGTVLAGVLQSGTIVSLMVLSFAGAGILSLASGIGVIVGANVGGTFLSVIIAKLGFGYSISAISLPLIAVGGIFQFFKNKKLQLIGQLILSFGLLLFGIGYLKDSVSALAMSLDVAKYANMGWYVFYLGGALLALLLHSSGTATIIAMTALTAGIISFDQAVIAMLGASIGSALVSMYASLGGSTVKKQVALSHFGFNTLGAILFLFFVPWTKEFMELFMSTSGDNGPTAIAWYQVIYNVVTGILIYPFIGMIARFFERQSPKEKSDYQLMSPGASEDYEAGLKHDIVLLLKKIYKFNVHHLDIDQKILLDKTCTISEKQYASYHLKDEDLDEDYEVLKNIEEALLGGLFKRIYTGNDEDDDKYLRYYSIIQSLLYSAKSLKDVRDNYLSLYQLDSLLIKERLQDLKEQMIDLYLVIAQVIDADSIEGFTDIITTELAEVAGTTKESADLLGQHLHTRSLPSGQMSALLHLTDGVKRSHDHIIVSLQELYGHK